MIGYWVLGIGIYLGLGICYLVFVSYLSCIRGQYL
jgi:hypothetical protein